MSGVINSAPIGVENLVYATLTDEDTLTYDTPKLVSPAINIKISPKSSSDTLYADNRAVETATSLGEIDVEIETQDLPLEVQAELLGHKIDSTSKVMCSDVQDSAPYVAMGFKIKKANSKHRYVWLLKGKFSEPDEEHSSQEDKTKFQTPKIKGTFLTRTDGKWKYTADEDSGFTGGATWFNKVYGQPIIPAAPTNPVQDDTANTFGWTNVSGYSNASDYEYSVDGGATWSAVTANPQSVGNASYAVGKVQVRVKADAGTNRSVGLGLSSTAAYTAS
ncbi:major tail protein [Clostridium guangxiense]|uniref:major tail protein n=1 Tax=Clostridium guangxiense TaxID=1662055 RepID=UPI001E360617|nr:major tail protein [Clostridium guangxiense]MCD2347185.1 major tail protein [Clostridium guangxiense]